MKKCKSMRRNKYCGLKSTVFEQIVRTIFIHLHVKTCSLLTIWDKNNFKKRKLKILAVLGQGGHTKQALKIVNLLSVKYDYSYIISYVDNISEKKIRIKGPTYKIKRLTRIDKKAEGNKSFLLYGNLLRSFIASLMIYLKEKPDVILSAGSGITLPIALISKLFGKKFKIGRAHV